MQGGQKGSLREALGEGLFYRLVTKNAGVIYFLGAIISNLVLIPPFLFLLCFGSRQKREEEMVGPAEGSV